MSSLACPLGVACLLALLFVKKRQRYRRKRKTCGRNQENCIRRVPCRLADMSAAGTGLIPGTKISYTGARRLTTNQAVQIRRRCCVRMRIEYQRPGQTRPKTRLDHLARRYTYGAETPILQPKQNSAKTPRNNREVSPSFMQNLAYVLGFRIVAFAQCCLIVIQTSAHGQACLWSNPSASGGRDERHAS